MWGTDIPLERMKANEAPSRTVKAAETTFAILEVLSEGAGMRLTEVAEELDMAKSTVHRYLQTLLDRRYIVKEDNKYHISLRFLDLGENARNRKEGYKMSKAKVEELAEETQERAQFIVEEHGQAVYVHRKAGDHAVHTDPGIGKRSYLHATSAGKAIIAEWPENRIEEYIERQGLQSLTENTIISEERLMEEIAEVRERGYATNMQENIDGLCAVGVAVSPNDSEVLGALSVSGPLNRMQDEWFEQELPDMLMGFANEIELNLRYS
jgi:DNA-binding IclR family transcriptional regulator